MKLSNQPDTKICLIAQKMIMRGIMIDKAVSERCQQLACEFVGISIDKVAPEDESEADIYIREFIEKWGELTQENLEHVISTQQNTDSFFASSYWCFSLRETHQPIDLDRYVHHPSLSVKWAFTLILAQHHYPQAFGPLCGLLEANLTPDEFDPFTQSEEQFIIHTLRLSVPDILANYQNSLAIPYLKGTLDSLCTLEYDRSDEDIQEESEYDEQEGAELPDLLNEFVGDKGLAPLENYQADIIYVLGRYQAWGTLPLNVLIPPEKLTLWMVHLAAGSTYGRYTTKSVLRLEDHPEMLTNIQKILRETFGLTEGKIKEAIHAYNQSPYLGLHRFYVYRHTIEHSPGFSQK
jgi:hypothetical protein